MNTGRTANMKGVHVGFTGTQLGMTPPQAEKVRQSLQTIIKVFGADGHTVLHHGDCIGADQQAHEIALELGLSIHIHPPIKEVKRAFCVGAEHVYPPDDYLARNRVIVQSTSILIAAPKKPPMCEELRSGTWMTIRCAKTSGKIVWVIGPRGFIRIISPD